MYSPLHLNLGAVSYDHGEQLPFFELYTPYKYAQDLEPNTQQPKFQLPFQHPPDNSPLPNKRVDLYFELVGSIRLLHNPHFHLPMECTKTYERQIQLWRIRNPICCSKVVHIVAVRQMLCCWRNLWMDPELLALPTELMVPTLPNIEMTPRNIHELIRWWQLSRTGCKWWHLFRGFVHGYQSLPIF